jgi:hypothetical protein
MTYIKASCIVQPWNIKIQRTFFFITEFCFALGFKKYTRHLIRKFTIWYHLESLKVYEG